MFKAIYLTKSEDGKTLAQIKDMDLTELPLVDGGVTVDIEFSTINFKDGLAITGKSPVVRKFPMVPGIDFCGKVKESQSANWKVGDEVILNGWGVGESHWGGLSQVARVSGDWLIAKPQALSSQDCMSIGTAGYTAMLCVLALERNGVRPDSGEILVTGASGGVGSFAISILSALGYQVVASTGKKDEYGFLIDLGAKEVIERSLLSEAGKPLQKERWAGVVDTVGSHTLANACASTKYGGVVTACGLAGGMDLPLTVAPFILRGVSLIGVDSVMASKAVRENAWTRLSTDLKPSVISQIAKVVSLRDAINVGEDILKGSIKGRVVVNVNQ
ncbi:oxidoreductase [Polynucleobacter paneuropaeus]|jgi:acrylyl-CoA reductase (NADPH)|nr:oxidoreductase [Polynucleobacter paneuropaeus]MBT8616242.1 oxidoreductase [Polynucleobacter paneuropaeus]MBT8618123.1 oxidoreductase [Polynucleobacter paneuropaeus]MBT8620404.1 oxidoreductase [Polynucleobacter paneuropaeus]MBT8625539.1 oxidoreductase [Polynucleobacter paneuropaeus]